MPVRDAPTARRVRVALVEPEIERVDRITPGRDVLRARRAAEQRDPRTEARAHRSARCRPAGACAARRAVAGARRIPRAEIAHERTRRVVRETAARAREVVAVKTCGAR